MLSKSAEYALRATIYIALKSSEDHKLGIDEIAAAIDSPQSFTAKIMQLLTKNNGVVSSVRGPNGGFYLTEAAQKLPVSAVLEAVGEYGILTKCVLGLKECSESRPCPMHEQYRTIRTQMKLMFDKTTIRDLAEETGKGKIVINNRPVKKK
ncbi:RrF2 family transcriptional regulator [Chitinophaga lutea]